MGERGPAPKRSDQKRRRNKPDVPVEQAEGADEVEIPAADPEWHPVAAQFYAALAKSGQSVFYEPSDWALAYALAESMSLEFKPQPVVDKDGNVTWVRFPPKGASLAAWLKGMTVLLVGEGDRRRVRLELQRQAPEGGDDDADVSELAEYRNRLSG